MSKLVSISLGLSLIFAGSCGSDPGDDDSGEDTTPKAGNDTVGDTTGVTGSDPLAGGDSETNVAGDGTTGSDIAPPPDGGVAADTDTAPAAIDGLTACTDFQVASWDRIRECDSPTAAILPPNELAGTVCAELCETEGKVVSQSAYDACLTYARTIDCSEIDIDLDAGSQIPEACGFLQEMNCLF